MNGRSRPYRVSALHEFHLAHGAVMGDIGEWRIAERYGDEGVETAAAAERCAIVDISPIRTVEILDAGLDRWLASSFDFDRPLSVGEVRRVGDGAIARLRPDRVWRRSLDATIAGPDLPGTPVVDGIWVADCSHGITGIGLVGPRAGEVLSMRATASRALRRFQDGTVIQTGVAGVPAVIVELAAPNHPVYQLLVGRHHGLYVWHHLEQAVRRLGGAVAGWNAWGAYVASALPFVTQSVTGEAR